MKQWYCAVGRDQYGPVGQDELCLWVREGRIKPSDLVWSEGMAEWTKATAVAGLLATPGTPPPLLKPHRGAAVLALGITGIMPCFVCGIIAWVMARRDLAEMEAGQMDSSGRGLTTAGKVCGIVGVCFWAIYLVFYAVFLLVFLLSHAF